MEARRVVCGCNQICMSVYNTHTCMACSTEKPEMCFTFFMQVYPVDNLKVQQLQTELELRGVSTVGKKKSELEKDFEDPRHVPALM